MSERPPSRLTLRPRPGQDDDGAPNGESSRSSLGWARGLLGSFGLEKRRDPMVLVDRPGKPAGQARSELMQMRDELRARLLVHDPATQAVRNLFVVHKELGANGWVGVDALPLQVLNRALCEAEMQQSQDPSPLLEMLIDRLRESHAAADVQIEAPAIPEEPDWEIPAVGEVTETTFDEYEVMERSWVGTIPSGLMELPSPTPE